MWGSRGYRGRRRVTALGAGDDVGRRRSAAVIGRPGGGGGHGRGAGAVGAGRRRGRRGRRRVERQHVGTGADDEETER
jgi:hypothetical protein